MPIPNKRKLIPVQDMIVKCSPNRKTPNMAAVNGSAKDKVTAVDEETWARPFANRR